MKVFLGFFVFFLLILLGAVLVHAGIFINSSSFWLIVLIVIAIIASLDFVLSDENFNEEDEKEYEEKGQKK